MGAESEEMEAIEKKSKKKVGICNKGDKGA
jgi:hypothetical protein